jgi:hypothetical protein
MGLGIDILLPGKDDFRTNSTHEVKLNVNRVR